MMRRIEKIGRGMSIVVMLSLTSCAGTETFVESPEVTLVRVEAGSLSLTRQTVHLGFDVHNPNAFALPVKSVRYNLRLGEQRFISGETQGDLTVPAGGDSSFVISVDLDVRQQASQLASLLRAGLTEDVAYELSGTLTVNIPFTRPIPFSQQGVISMSGHF